MNHFHFEIFYKFKRAGLVTLLSLTLAGLNFHDFKKNREIKVPRKKVFAKIKSAKFNTLLIQPFH